MPITYPVQQPIPTVVRPSESQYITPEWQSAYNFITLDNGGALPGEAPPVRVLAIRPDAFMPNAEIIIRIDRWSAQYSKAQIYFHEPYEWDMSGKLGLTMFPGGIAELRRVGASNIWSLYGYIGTDTDPEDQT